MLYFAPRAAASMMLSFPKDEISEILLLFCDNACFSDAPRARFFPLIVVVDHVQEGMYVRICTLLCNKDVLEYF